MHLITGVFKALIFSRGEIKMVTSTISYFFTSLPGIIIRMVIVPSNVFALM